MKNELNAYDLALYIGQLCQTEYGVGRITSVEITTGQFIIEYGTFDSDWTIKHLPCGHKLVLRRLSDMLPEDNRNIIALSDPLFEVPNWSKEFSFDGDAHHMCFFEQIIGQPQCWQYLLQNGYDLFGWIDAGLAIDRKTLKND